MLQPRTSSMLFLWYKKPRCGPQMLMYMYSMCRYGCSRVCVRAARRMRLPMEWPTKER